MNKHHIPLTIMVSIKKKPFIFGTYGLKAYFDNKIKNDLELTNTIKADQDELNLATDYNYMDGNPNEAYQQLTAGLGPAFLDYPLDLMNYDELANWLTRAINKDAANRGITNKTGMIKFKDHK